MIEAFTVGQHCTEQFPSQHLNTPLSLYTGFTPTLTSQITASTQTILRYTDYRLSQCSVRVLRLELNFYILGTCNTRGSVRSTRGLGPTMTARGQSIGISIGMLPQTLIMSITVQKTCKYYTTEFDLEKGF